MVLLAAFFASAPGFVFAAPEEASTAERQRHHQLGVDVGSDVDPDILSPSAPQGLDRRFEWDYRFVIREDRAGVNAQYHNPKRLQKLSFSYRQRMDFPSRAGLGPTRNRLYKSLGQKTRSRDVSGYVAGSALVLNPYWGISLVHDEYVKDNANELFNQHATTLGLGYSPLGDNRGRPWSYTIDPSVTYARFHGLKPVPNQHWESFGYSLGSSFYYGLDWVRVPLGRSFKLDRLKLSVSVSDAEVSDFAINGGVDLTAYATRHIKLKLGVENSYTPETGKHSFRLRAGLSLRLTWSDLNF